MNEAYQKSTLKTTPITPEFTNARLTNFAGMVPFSDILLDKLNFRQALAEHLDLGRGGELPVSGLANRRVNRVWLFMRVPAAGPFRTAQPRFHRPKAAGPERAG